MSHLGWDDPNITATLGWQLCMSYLFIIFRFGSRSLFIFARKEVKPKKKLQKTRLKFIETNVGAATWQERQLNQKRKRNRRYLDHVSIHSSSFIPGLMRMSQPLFLCLTTPTQNILFGSFAASSWTNARYNLLFLMDAFANRTRNHQLFNYYPEVNQLVCPVANFLLSVYLVCHTKPCHNLASLSYSLHCRLPTE